MALRTNQSLSGTVPVHMESIPFGLEDYPRPLRRPPAADTDHRRDLGGHRTPPMGHPIRIDPAEAKGPLDSLEPLPLP